MIKPEELKDKEYKIFIGLPCYGGLISESVFHSLAQTIEWGKQRGVAMRLQTMGNESLVSRARNNMVTMMMDATDYAATHLLFVDADIGFTYQNIERLLCADKDVVCGIYPRKYIHWEKTIQAVKENPNITEEELEAKSLGYNVNFDDSSNIQFDNGFAKVKEAATGMMLIKKEVIKTMQKKFPERKYESDQNINGKTFNSDNCYDLFAVGIYDKNEEKRYLSEDYYFSKLWRECEGEIWADCAMPLTHFGNYDFKGQISTTFQFGD